MATSPAVVMQVDVHLDLICPWCWIGKTHLDVARRLLALHQPDVQLEIRWHSVQLKRSQKFAPTQSKEISDAIARLCPSAIKDRKMVNRSQHRGYKLPTLSVARQEFEQAYNCTVDWDESIEDTTDQSTSDGADLVEVASVATTCQVSWQAKAQ